MFLRYMAIFQRTGPCFHTRYFTHFKQGGLYETSFPSFTQAVTIETKTSFLPSTQAVTIETKTSFLFYTQAVTIETETKTSFLFYTQAVTIEMKHI